MGKRQLTLYVDDELVQLAKNRGINLSFEFNEYLKARVFGAETGDINKKEELDKIINEKENELIALKRQRGDMEEKIVKIKDEKLKKEIEQALT